MLTKLIQQQLHRAQQRMKSQADKIRTEREFSVGELVYLKLQPYIQSSVAPRSNQKLAFKYFGPFPIIQRIGKVAYKLQLSEDCRIHPVIHVSQLKRHVPSHIQVSTTLDSIPDTNSEILPVAVLDRRCIYAGSTPKTQLLV